METPSFVRDGRLTMLPFDAAQLGVYVKPGGRPNIATLQTAQDVFAAVPDALAALDGNMFDGSSTIVFANYDPRTGTNVAGATRSARLGDTTTVGATLSVVDGRAVWANGRRVAPGASAAVQLYPKLVWDGQNVQDRNVDTDSVWRAGVGELEDGRLLFAVYKGANHDFATALVNTTALGSRVVRFGYTDGGNSTDLALRDGTRAGYPLGPGLHKVAAHVIVHAPVPGAPAPGTGVGGVLAGATSVPPGKAGALALLGLGLAGLVVAGVMLYARRA